MRGRLRDVRIGEVHVRNGRLVILPDDPQKLPLEFGLQDLTLTDFSFDRSHARLPPGWSTRNRAL